MTGSGASSLREDRAFAAAPSSQSSLSRPSGLQSACAAILRERGEREKLFPKLREPEWLILLDLSAMAARGRQLSISDLRYSIFAPATTTLRHIGRLAHKGLVERTVDETDKRRVFLSLSVLAMERLDRFADAIADRNPSGGDVKQAPSLMSGGGADRQSPNPNSPRTD